MKRTPTIFALLFINIGIFVGTLSLLPTRGSWMHSGPISYFVNSRDRWDIAWGILTASIIISIGVFFLLHAKRAFDENPERIEQGGGGQAATRSESS